MAGETKASDIGDSVAAEIVNDSLIATAYAAACSDLMIRHDTVSGSTIKSYPRLGKLTAAALTDGTDGTATALTDTQVSATIAEVGIGVHLTDMAKVASSVKGMAEAATSLLGQAYADKIELNNLALTASLTDSVGSTGAAFTEDLFFAGSYEVEANDGIGLTLAAILTPKQYNQLVTAIGGSSYNGSAVWGREDMLGRPAPADIRGFKNVINGIPVFISTNVVAVNGDTDRGGCVMAVGDMSPFIRVVGVLDGMEWDGRLEYQRDTSLRATEAWVTGATGVACVAADRGCRYLSIK